jgi:deoxyribonuclease V
MNRKNFLKTAGSFSWDMSVREAIALQKAWAPRVLRRNARRTWRTVAGADLAFDDSGKMAVAGIILFEYPALKEIERAWVRAPLRFPYVPGLLSFREGPVLVQALAKLRRIPDLLMIDGQGVAHPRRFGIASHMGVLCDLPTIGCAKSRLCGEFEEPGPRRGDWSPLRDGRETIGAVLRTRDHCRPLFVSVGHQVGLATAIRMVLVCGGAYRIPIPTREADLWVGELKRKPSGAKPLAPRGRRV